MPISMTTDSWGLRQSGVPLGGLGTGSVELRADGYFHEWQIMNNRPWGAGPEFQGQPDLAFFAVQLRGAGVQRTLLLAQTPPANHFLNNPYHAPFVEHAARIDAEVRFPFTRLQFHYEKEAPVTIALEAFSPFIPLDSRHSALPVAFFTVTVLNTGAIPLEVSVMQVASNLAGYNQPTSLSVMTPAAADDGPASRLRFSREGCAPDSQDNGTMVIGALGAGEGGFVCHPRQDRDLWEPLRLTGRLDNQDHGVYRGEVGNQGEGQTSVKLRSGTPKGAVARVLAVAPGQTQAVTFALAWHFPNMWDRDFARQQVKATRIGHWYENEFADAEAVFGYAAGRVDWLRQESLAFAEGYYASSLARWQLDAIAAQFTTLIKSSWYDRAGRFGIWEGLGCCGLQTVDVAHYASFPIIQWFPDLQQSQMRLSAAHVTPAGKVPHMMPGNFSCSDLTENRGRIDLIPQFVLSAWRDVRWQGDREYARLLWPLVVQALDFFQPFDTDGDGLPNNEGPDQTYDQFPLLGTSSFVGFLYAAALRAAADLGHWLGDVKQAQVFSRRLDAALPELDRQLWTGRYYRLSHDPATGQRDDGVMADQLNGDWFLRQSAATGLVADDRARRALQAIWQHCLNRDQGYLANCAWPGGGGVPIGRHTADQANMPWTGVEYMLAAHLLLLGLEREGWELVRLVWGRHERAGLRFNHIECGEHYYRALSSWAIYLAWAGYWWNALEEELLVTLARDRVFVLHTPTGWGTAAVSRQGMNLHLVKGTVTVRRLAFRDAPAGRTFTVTANGKPCPIQLSADQDHLLRLTLAAPLRLQAGGQLAVQ